MVPWFTMPSRADARRAALIVDVRQRLDSVQCAVQLVRRSEISVRDRALLERLADELREVRSMLERVAVVP